MTLNSEIKKNCTTIFIVPSFQVGKERLLKNGFLGGFLGDITRPDMSIERGIYFLFKPQNFQLFEDFLHEEKERGAPIMDDYDYDGFVVVVYVVPEEFISDFKRFTLGKYSKYSVKFKSLFPRTVRREMPNGVERDEVSLQHRVFTRDKGLQEYWRNKLDIEVPPDLELYSSPDLSINSEEYLDIDKYKEGEEVNV